LEQSARRPLTRETDPTMNGATCAPQSRFTCVRRAFAPASGSKAADEAVGHLSNMKTKIPVKWANFWNSREMFPLLVDPAIAEDRFTFSDKEVTFFTDVGTSQEESYRSLIRQRSFWGLPEASRNAPIKRKRIVDS